MNNAIKHKEGKQWYNGVVDSDGLVLNDKQIILTRLQGQWIRWDKRVSFTIQGQNIKDIKSIDGVVVTSFLLNFSKKRSKWEISCLLFGANSVLNHVSGNRFTILSDSNTYIAPQIIEPAYYWRGRVTFDRMDSSNLLQSTVTEYTEENIKQYIGEYTGLIRNEVNDILQYRMLHDEWKLNKTDEAFEKLLRKKNHYEKAQKEAHKAQIQLIDRGLWRWVDTDLINQYHRELILTHSKYIEYHSITRIRQIFNSYKEYMPYILINEYTEPDNRKEEMENLLAKLPYVFYQNYLPLLIEVWMYYDMPHFVARKILNDHFERNYKVLVPAIRIRIKNKKKWESVDTTPYADLLKLEKKLADILITHKSGQ